LPRVLEGILSLNYPSKRIELIFVPYSDDYRSIEILRDFISKYGERYYDVKVLTRNDKRANYARNLGARNSRGDYIFLLNDDIVLHPDAIVKGLEIFRSDPRAGVVTFPYILSPPRIWEKAMFFRYLGKVSKIKSLNLGCSLVKKEVFEKAGYISEDMGPPISSNDDFEFSARIWRTGYRICIDGRIVLTDIGELKSSSSSRYSSTRKSGISRALTSLLNIARYDLSSGAKTFMKVLANAPISWRLEQALYFIIPLVYLALLLSNIKIFTIAIIGLVVAPFLLWRKISLVTPIYFILLLGRRIMRVYGLILHVVYCYITRRRET